MLVTASALTENSATISEVEARRGVLEPDLTLIVDVQWTAEAGATDPMTWRIGAISDPGSSAVETPIDTTVDGFCASER